VFKKTAVQTETDELDGAEIAKMRDKHRAASCASEDPRKSDRPDSAILDGCQDRATTF
jgi:hypothetical protein